MRDAISRLHAHCEVELPGAIGEGHRRWRRKSIVAAIAFGAVGLLGVLAIVIGLAYRERVGGLVIFGGFMALVGLPAAILMSLLPLLWRGQFKMHLHPVRISRDGIWLRGIGPVPWSDVAPPTYVRVMTKNEPGGRLAVMPFTPAGFARANHDVPTRMRPRLGPRVYLTTQFRYLLVPGVAGMTEHEVMQVLAEAHRMFAQRG